MNVHKINKILACDENELFTETTKLNHIQNLLKRATNMKKMLLKIRNEMKRNNIDIEHLINCKKTKQNNGQSQQSKVNYSDEHSDELCDSNKRHDHRSIITYDDLDSEYYAFNEESLCNSKQIEIRTSMTSAVIQTDKDNLFENESKAINETICELEQIQVKDNNRLIKNMHEVKSKRKAIQICLAIEANATNIQQLPLRVSEITEVKQSIKEQSEMLKLLSSSANIHSLSLNKVTATVENLHNFCNSINHLQKVQETSYCNSSDIITTQIKTLTNQIDHIVQIIGYIQTRME